MQYLKFVVAALSLLAVALGLSAGLQSLGGQGQFTLAMSAVPLLLVDLALGQRRPFARWMGAVSLLAFLIVGMKTSEAAALDGGHDLTRAARTGRGCGRPRSGRAHILVVPSIDASHRHDRETRRHHAPPQRGRTTDPRRSLAG